LSNLKIVGSEISASGNWKKGLGLCQARKINICSSTQSNLLLNGKLVTKREQLGHSWKREGGCVQGYWKERVQ